MVDKLTIVNLQTRKFRLTIWYVTNIWKGTVGWTGLDRSECSHINPIALTGWTRMSICVGEVRFEGRLIFIRIPIITIWWTGQVLGADIWLAFIVKPIVLAWGVCGFMCVGTIWFAIGVSFIHIPLPIIQWNGITIAVVLVPLKFAWIWSVSDGAIMPLCSIEHCPNMSSFSRERNWQMSPFAIASESVWLVCCKRVRL